MIERMQGMVTRQDLTRFFLTGNTTKSSTRSAPKKVRSKPKKRKK